MSIADAAPELLHRCVQVGWVPQVVDENASLRLQVALLTGQRDDLAGELARMTQAADALWDRVRELEIAAEDRLLLRAIPRPRPSRLAVAWAATCALWFAFWARFETDESAMGEWV